MNVELYDFQELALRDLRVRCDLALQSYKSANVPQIISYSAPTGAGKTIIISALIESIFFGDGEFADDPDAIFVWLSDSPELNLQSMNKIEQKADKIRIGQCIQITDESFDKEYLDDGHIYFLNTQKLGKSGNLTKKGDNRQYTIWETLANTAREKSDRLFFIIDEAHRGMQGRKAGEATSIMQKFIKGSPNDGLPAMPVIIGMTATPERFNQLVSTASVSVHKVITTPDQVRSSGLLKERIIITYPDSVNNEMAILQAAAEEWKNKCDHWWQYCEKQHYTQVLPILVVQVQNASGSRGVSDTNLYDCLQKIEEQTGYRFMEGQVVHAFGEHTSVIDIGGLKVKYVEPSRIWEDRRIKVVFFKESLSTGWDCPRAETMMSFRRAIDATYIAQLLGRMVRTPLQQHVKVDETLNDVHLYLPYFDEATVKKVVDELKGSEGTLPVDIDTESYGHSRQEVYSTHSNYSQPIHRATQVQTGQVSFFDNIEQQPTLPTEPVSQQAVNINNSVQTQSEVSPQSSIGPSQNVSTIQQNATSQLHYPDEPTIQEIMNPGFDRDAVLNALNKAGILTYDVRKVAVTNYLTSMFRLAHLLCRNGIYDTAVEDIFNDFIVLIHKYIIKLQVEGKYEEEVEKVKTFKMNTQVFDVFGETVDNYMIHDLFSITDTDVDRQFRLAERKFAAEGVGRAYGNKYLDDAAPSQYMIDVIIFVNNPECMDKLNAYAREKFHELNDKFRVRIAEYPLRVQNDYDSIVANGDIISKHNFRLPDRVAVDRVDGGKIYTNHLIISETTGVARFRLNAWEDAVIEEEATQPDFICWFRNPPKKPWSLCVPYYLGAVAERMYPDFIIVRDNGNGGYIFDVLEPHNPGYSDNLPKAKGLAEYARQNPGVGRIQLIRIKTFNGTQRIIRLDLGESIVREEVLRAQNPLELDNIFENRGKYYHN